MQEEDFNLLECYDSRFHRELLNTDPQVKELHSCSKQINKAEREPGLRAATELLNVINKNTVMLSVLLMTASSLQDLHQCREIVSCVTDIAHRALLQVLLLPFVVSV